MKILEAVLAIAPGACNLDTRFPKLKGGFSFVMLPEGLHIQHREAITGVLMPWPMVHFVVTAPDLTQELVSKVLTTFATKEPSVSPRGFEKVTTIKSKPLKVAA